MNPSPECPAKAEQTALRSLDSGSSAHVYLHETLHEYKRYYEHQNFARATKITRMCHECVRLDVDATTLSPSLSLVLAVTLVSVMNYVTHVVIPSGSCSWFWLTIVEHLNTKNESNQKWSWRKSLLMQPATSETPPNSFPRAWPAAYNPSMRKRCLFMINEKVNLASFVFFTFALARSICLLSISRIATFCTEKECRRIFAFKATFSTFPYLSHSCRRIQSCFLKWVPDMYWSFAF